MSPLHTQIPSGEESFIWWNLKTQKERVFCRQLCAKSRIKVIHIKNSCWLCCYPSLPWGKELFPAVPWEGITWPLSPSAVWFFFTRSDNVEVAGDCFLFGINVLFYSATGLFHGGFKKLDGPLKKGEFFFSIHLGFWTGFVRLVSCVCFVEAPSSVLKISRR